LSRGTEEKQGNLRITGSRPRIKQRNTVTRSRKTNHYNVTSGVWCLDRGTILSLHFIRDHDFRITLLACFTSIHETEKTEQNPEHIQWEAIQTDFC